MKQEWFIYKIQPIIRRKTKRHFAIGCEDFRNF